MSLNVSTGNMYDFISHTWNTVKGQCYHNCSYCSIKRIAKRFNQEQKPARFDESEMSTNLGEGNFIFVGSSNDLFADGKPFEWIQKTLKHCRKYPGNKYLFQTKNPEELFYWKNSLPGNSVICTTIESNRWYHEHMGKSPSPLGRSEAMQMIEQDKYITIEPIMDFGLGAFVEMIKSCNPVQVNIGADSGNNNLPEPSWDKIERLIMELEKFTIVKRKKNLERLRLTDGK